MGWRSTYAQRGAWTRDRMGHIYNHLLPFVRPAGNLQGWSGFPAPLLHLREVFPGQRWLLEDTFQISVLLKLLKLVHESFMSSFLKASQSCCFLSFLHITPLAFLDYTLISTSWLQAAIVAYSPLKTQWYNTVVQLYKSHIRRIVMSWSSSSDR